MWEEGKGETRGREEGGRTREERKEDERPAGIGGPRRLFWDPHF